MCILCPPAPTHIWNKFGNNNRNFNLCTVKLGYNEQRSFLFGITGVRYNLVITERSLATGFVITELHCSYNIQPNIMVHKLQALPTILSHALSNFLANSSFSFQLALNNFDEFVMFLAIQSCWVDLKQGWATIFVHGPHCAFIRVSQATLRP